MTISAAELLVYTRAVGAVDTELALAAIGVSVATVGVASVKMAANFQQNMTLLVTSANESQGNLKSVSDGILKMSVDTATGVDTLSTAMFTVESASYHGSQGLAVLKAAAEGAKVENADLTGVVQALTTTMHDWREPASQAVDVMNSFREAASIGNMRMDDFTGAMKNVGPVASLAAIHLTDVEAALSTMSLEGDKGAAAGTHLAQSLLNMISPSTKAQKVLAEIGLTAQQVSDDMKKSLPATLALITDDIGKKFPKGSEAYNHALSDMFGGTRGLKAILELTGQNLKDFENDASAIAPTMKANSTAVDGWSLVQQNFNFKLAAASDAVNVLMIKLGTEMLPTLGQVLSAVTPLITSFGDWIVASDGLSQVIQNSVTFYQQWQGVINTAAEAIALFFLPALIASGVEAAISAATIAGKFVVSIITTGIEGYAAAYKLVVFTASVIATGVESLIAGGKIAFSFVAGLVSTALQSGISAAVMSTTLIPSLIAVGAAAWAATGPFVLVGLAIAGVTAAVVLATPLISNMQKAVQDSSKKTTVAVEGTTQTIEASTGRIITSFGNMKSSVLADMSDMQKNVIIQGTHASSGLENLFNTMLAQVGGDFSKMSSDAYMYLQDVESYVTQAQAKILSARIGAGGTNIINKNFGGYAEGTDYSTAGYHWVGEQGPELLQLPMGSRVIPHHEIASSGGGSSSSSRSTSSNADRPLILQIDGRTFARVILPALTDQIRYGVGSVGI